MVLPVALRPLHHPLQGGSRPLLGDDEPVDGRPGPDHAPARSEADGCRPKRSSRTPPRERAERPADGRRRPRPRSRAREAVSAGPPRRCGGRRRGRDGELRTPALGGIAESSRRTGETVGEAKWIGAARARAAAFRGSSGTGHVRGAISEDSAGCSASARRPARVVAASTRSSPARAGCAGRGPSGGGTVGLPRSSATCSQEIATRSGAECRIDIEERDESIAARSRVAMSPS